MAPETPRIEICHSILEIDSVAWNQLNQGDFLFSDWRFLRALEVGGCLGERTGWFPHYLLFKNGEVLQAALPLYLKTNSYGEFIFDWAWANAAESIGIAYYPKLVSAIPFTPATGPKFLIRSDVDSVLARKALLGAARELEKTLNASSLHFLFTTEEEARALAPLLIRHSFQYHWQNRGWQTFQNFLDSLRAKRRSEIRREREAVRASGLKLEVLSGEELDPQYHAREAFAFYDSTTAKRGGFSYLTLKFFQELFCTMPESIVYCRALTATSDQAVAGALNLARGQTLFGRYWGCRDDYRNLHFELCYYQTIEWALARGMQRFEAGAQGEHKFNRGFTPALTFSAHDLSGLGHFQGEGSDSRLREAIERHIELEKKELEDIFREYKAHDPFKRPGETHA